MTWRDVEPTWNLVIGALSVFQLDWLSTIRVSCFFVIWDRIQVFVGYEPGLLFVRILNPVPRMSWLACVWKTVIRLPMFPVSNLHSFTSIPRDRDIDFRALQRPCTHHTLLLEPFVPTILTKCRKGERKLRVAQANLMN